MKKTYSFLFCVLFFMSSGCKTSQRDDFHANNVKFISFIMEQSIDQEKDLIYSQYRCQVYKLVLQYANLTKNIDNAQLTRDLKNLNIQFFGVDHYGYEIDGLIKFVCLAKDDAQQKIWLKANYDFLYSYLQAKHQKDKDKIIDTYADILIKFYQIDQRNTFLFGVNFYQYNAHTHNKKYLEAVCRVHDQNRAFDDYIGVIDKLVLKYAKHSEKLDENVLKAELNMIKTKHAVVYNQDPYALDWHRVKGLIQIARFDSQTRKYLQSTLDFFEQLNITPEGKKRYALIDSFADEFVSSLSMNLRNDNVIVINNRAMNKMIQCIIALDSRRQFDADIYKHVCDGLIHHEVIKDQDEDEKNYKKDLSEFFLQMSNIHDNDEKLKKIEEFASRYAECKKYYSKFGLAPVVNQDGQIIIEYFEL